MSLTIKERISGEVIASGEPDETVQVFEGNWYFSPDVVDMKYLKVTERTYTCPYKGTCYWVDLEAPGNTARNVGWIYENPLPGYEFIKDKVAFYARTTNATIAER
ncbi:MAG: DUF427 domain-containing protein [Chloroflexi bacterium]|nr:MAG: DUF427 domain-containing protein [Chloroflexota bacterium]